MSVATLPQIVAVTRVVQGPNVEVLSGRSGTWIYRQPRLSAHAARTEVRGARRRGHAVHVHRTTDRTGADMLVALVRHPEGTFDGLTYLADVYEIPVDALLDL